MMDIENRALDEDGVEDVEHLFHRPGVVLIPGVELGEGIDDDEGGLQVVDDLNEVSGIVGIVDHIEDGTHGRGGQDHEITLGTIFTKGGQGDAFLLEVFHALQPERVGGIELEVEDPTPFTDRGTPQEAGALGHGEANLKGEVRLPTLGGSDEQDTPWTRDKAVDQVIGFR